MSRNPRTAKKANSIWREVSENTFRSHMIRLSKLSNQVPAQPRTNPPPREFQSDSTFGVECMLAQDFAFLAAAHEGVESVSAAYVENLGTQRDIVVRIASNGGVSEAVQDFLADIITLLQRCAAHGIAKRACQEQLHHIIVRFHQARIHGRLRSAKWVRPMHLHAHRKALVPIWYEVHQLCDPMSTTQHRQIDDSLRDALLSVADAMKIYDGIDEVTRELELLQQITKLCFNICTAQGTQNLGETLTQGNLPDNFSNSAFQQLEKIGAYYRIAQDMVSVARKYPQMMSNISCQYVEPYRHTSSHISPRAKATSCHVHAEVQLVVFHDTKSPGEQPFVNKPRVIGSSKAACFLCALFLQKHGHFFFPQEHAKLYDQWTIPDLNEYSHDILLRYRRIIRLMNAAFLELSRRIHPNRPFPLTSWQDFRKLPFTPEDSSHSVSAITVRSLQPGKIDEGSSKVVTSLPGPQVFQSDVAESEEHSESIMGLEGNAPSGTFEAPGPEIAATALLRETLPLSQPATARLRNETCVQHLQLKSPPIEVFVELDEQAEVGLGKVCNGSVPNKDDETDVWRIVLGELEVGKDIVWTCSGTCKTLAILILDERATHWNTEPVTWMLKLSRII